MFNPEILEKNDNCIKMRINEAIVITVDNDKFDDAGTIDVEFDEKIITHKKQNN